MFDAILPPGARAALAALAERKPLPPQSYMAGGTALALQLGHRRSKDLDFFTPIDFNVDQTLEQLSRLPEFHLTSRSAGTIHAVTGGTLLSLLHHPRPLIEPTVEYRAIALASVPDIAAMKLTAVADRGLRRDFVDIVALLERYSLAELLEFYDRRYQALAVNRVHLLKSLTYFFDAEADDHPETLVAGVDWDSVKAKLTAAVRALEEQR